MWSGACRWCLALWNLLFKLGGEGNAWELLLDWGNLSMITRLDGKAALVTGASRGIGFAIARQFVDAGAKVMITARRAEDLKAAAARLSTCAEKVMWRVANAGKAEDADACVEAAVEQFGTLDVLVNNAATNPYFGPLLDLDWLRAMKTVEVNQWGPIAWSRAAYRSGMQQRGGAILNIASIGGFAPERNIGWYNATKASVLHVTRQLAYELSPEVRVNALAPGLVRTHFARALWERHEEEIASRLPLRRIGVPTDIAGAALFLVSDEASWITGSVLTVDGGGECPALWRYFLRYRTRGKFMDFNMSPKSAELHARLTRFVHERILPSEEDYDR